MGLNNFAEWDIISHPAGWQKGDDFMKDELTRRINELAHKEKAEGLTEEEKAEQIKLRNEFRLRFRASFAGQLENTVIKRPDGTIEKLSDIRKKEDK